MRWESPLVLDLPDYTGNVPALFLSIVAIALTFDLDAIKSISVKASQRNVGHSIRTGKS